MVKAPFVQLWSIHAFTRVGDKEKQLPLAYFLMSRKTTHDYRYILRALKMQLMNLASQQQEQQQQHSEDSHCEHQIEPWAVQIVVGDFEKAVWEAIRQGELLI